MKQRSPGGWDRRHFLRLAAMTAVGLVGAGAVAGQSPKRELHPMKTSTDQPRAHRGYVTLFMCGDVMTGRGIDQVLPDPVDPRLYEPYVQSADTYVMLAEEANGPIPKPVDYAYVWGDALAELERAAPDVRLINLETAVTRSDDCWPGKGIHYRMSPGNMACITAAHIDCCTLANNHVLDWGYAGLEETLANLNKAGVKTTGAGLDVREAEEPAVIDLAGRGRVVVFSLGSDSSGIPPEWAASRNKPGVNLLDDLSGKTLERIAKQVRAVKRQGDIVVASIHWGGNWGYGIDTAHVAFAHQLIDEAGVDVIHGHSSHHPKAIEVYRGKLILYGCGDFLNDYEGIRGYEVFRDDLTLMYLAGVDPAGGTLIELKMIPMLIKRFRLNLASQEDGEWLRAVLDRECRKRGARVEGANGNTLVLRFTD